ncbi:MAG: glutaminyl-peptide cyclotransferase [Pseudomonadota bacterium]
MKKIILLASIAFFFVSVFVAIDGSKNCYLQISRRKILSQKKIPVYGFKVIKSYPHDTNSYTEGLVYENGILYESVGLYGHSKLIKSNLVSGQKIQVVKLANKYFGEGMTVFNKHIYQLTYQSKTGIVYDKHTLKAVKKFKYNSQGWGLTHNGKYLIVSNGSSAIQFIDPNNFKVAKVIFVKAGHRPVGSINELEYINHKIFANIWKTNFIAIISPKNGKVIGWLDLTRLNPNPRKLKTPYVLNGIAWDAKNHSLLVTGKCWPKIYEIRPLPSKTNRFPQMT